ncbi:velvet factor-domain-containing protein [Schizophyllum fasciatum]
MFSDSSYVYSRGNSAESAQENISPINYMAGSRQIGGSMPDPGEACFPTYPAVCTTKYSHLDEIQQPLMCRKYATVDRRPLDPPPVVRLRVFEVLNQGTAYAHQNEVTSAIDTAAYTCVAHLHSARSPSIVPPGMSTGGFLGQSPAACQSYTSEPWTGGPVGAPGLMTTSRPFHPLPQEGSDLTQDLIGGKVATAKTIVLNGEEQVVFAFPDLSVRLEGEFYLRYSLFDLNSMIMIPGSERPTSTCQATCYGGLFTVYATKEAPPLPPSTALTKVLHDSGVRATYRARQRTRRRGDATSPSDTSST